MAQIEIESGGDPDAVGAAGERGLLQISEPAWLEMCRKTGKKWPYSESFNPRRNMYIGISYLSRLQKWARSHDFKPDLYYALIAYNCGMGNTIRGRVPERSRSYARRILNLANSP